MRNAGLRYRDLEEKQRLFMPVMEAHVDYLAPARYDDLIRVRTFLGELGGAHVIFRHESIWLKPARYRPRPYEACGREFALAPTRFPDDLRHLLQPARRLNNR